MACVKDNSLSDTDKKVMESIQENFLSVEEIADKTDLPLFRVRSILRKLVENGHVEIKDDKYILINK